MADDKSGSVTGGIMGFLLLVALIIIMVYIFMARNSLSDVVNAEYQERVEQGITVLMWSAMLALIFVIFVVVIAGIMKMKTKGGFTAGMMGFSGILVIGLAISGAMSVGVQYVLVGFVEEEQGDNKDLIQDAIDKLQVVWITLLIFLILCIFAFIFMIYKVYKVSEKVKSKEDTKKDDSIELSEMPSSSSNE